MSTTKKLSEMTKEELKEILDNDAERRTYSDHVFDQFDEAGAGTIPRPAIVDYIKEKYPAMTAHPLFVEFSGQEGDVTKDIMFGALSKFIHFLYENHA